MNGKLAVNIDEEALFEVLVAANFAPPAARASMPLRLIDSADEGNSTFPGFPDPANHNPSSASLSRLF